MAGCGVTCGGDTLYEHPATNGGERLNHEKANIPEEALAAVGSAVSQLIKAGRPVHMQDITARLHHLMEETDDIALKKSLLHAVRLIADKMN